MSDFKKQFGENLKKLRKLRKLTQEQLAELIDVHFRQMSKIETGENFPSSKTIEKLCRALKVSPAMLFEFEFQLEAEYALTGTDDQLNYFKAIKKDNVIILQDYIGRTQEDSSLFESETRLKNIAQASKTAIAVEYFENGNRTKTLIFQPDGKIEPLKNPDQNKTIDRELLNIFKETENYKEYEEFIKLAIKSTKDDDALRQLEFVINGIKMARKIK